VRRLKDFQRGEGKVSMRRPCAINAVRAPSVRIRAPPSAFVRPQGARTNPKTWTDCAWMRADADG